jgi:plastocyanin
MRVAITILGAAVLAMAHSHPERTPDYLPEGDALGYLTVEKGGRPEQNLVVLTEAVAVKETGPKETVKKFGEVYAFSPAFLAVPLEKPIEISFWNLQPDDEHDILIVAPDQTVLMHWSLAPLSKTPFTYTFHKQGIYSVICALHRPEMTAQILVQQ